MMTNEPIRIADYRRPVATTMRREEAERQFKASLVLMALIGSACIATTFATLAQIG